MLLEKIHELWETDAKIDISDIGGETLKISQLHSKYFKILNSERKNLAKKNSELSILKIDKISFYTNGASKEDLAKGWIYPKNAPNGKIIKSDVSLYLDADKELIEIKLEIAELEEKIDLLKSILDTIIKRSFVINTYVSHLKFINGVD